MLMQFIHNCTKPDYVYTGLYFFLLRKKSNSIIRQVALPCIEIFTFCTWNYNILNLGKQAIIHTYRFDSLNTGQWVSAGFWVFLSGNHWYRINEDSFKNLAILRKANTDGTDEDRKARTKELDELEHRLNQELDDDPGYLYLKMRKKIVDFVISSDISADSNEATNASKILKNVAKVALAILCGLIASYCLGIAVGCVHLLVNSPTIHTFIYASECLASIMINDIIIEIVDKVLY